MNIPPRLITTSMPLPSTQLSDVQAQGHVTTGYQGAPDANDVSGSQIGDGARAGRQLAGNERQASDARRALQTKTVLNAVRMKLGQSSQDADAKARAVRQKARENLDRIAADRSQAIRSREVPRWDTALTRKKNEEWNQAQKFAGFYHALFSKVTGSESPMELLAKLARENEALQQFSYRSDKKRDPFDMVTERDGDCESYANVFKMLAETAGVEGLAYHHFEAPMSFTAADIPGGGSQLGNSIDFARHTILACRGADGRVEYFDPVFGRQIDPEHYGKDVDLYLKRRPPAE